MKETFTITPAEIGELTVEPVKLFDITAVIGSVYRGGDHSPRVAAFMLIAEHNADGEYTFPDEGKHITVGVVHHT